MFPTYEVFVPTDEVFVTTEPERFHRSKFFLPSELFTAASERTFLPTEPETLHRS